MSRVHLTQPLARGVLRRRYKRFLADVRLDDGTESTVHCANSGSMKGMDMPGLPCLVSDSQNPARKLRHTLEMVQVDDGGGKTWVGVNTARPNHHVEAAIRAGAVPGLDAEVPLRREVRYGTNSRIDLLAGHPDDGPLTYVEVKNTTLAARHHDGVLEARFPDAVTARGQKHVRELMAMVDAGHHALFVFFVNRADVTRFAAAEDIDPEYAALLAEAADHGVGVLPLQVHNQVRRHADGARARLTWQQELPVRR